MRYDLTRRNSVCYNVRAYLDAGVAGVCALIFHIFDVT
jgi:hypothetical protein